MKTYRNIIGSWKVKVILGLIALAPLSSMADPCAGPFPDLQIRELRMTKAFKCKVSGGKDVMYIQVTIENMGATTQEKFHVEIKTEAHTRRVTVRGLERGETRELTASYIYAPKKRNVILTAKVDDANVIRESNERNNSRSISVRNNCR